MDILHGDPMYGAARQMMHALAEKEIRPIAEKHDREESMPWDLMKKVKAFGLGQSAMLEASRIAGDEEGAAGEKKPSRGGRLSPAPGRRSPPRPARSPSRSSTARRGGRAVRTGPGSS